MRFLLAGISGLLLAAPFAIASEVRVVRVWPSYRAKESFMRISEYFTGRESTGNEEILRTQPATRDGYYFLARLKNTGAALPQAKVELEVITPLSPAAKTYTFTAPLPSGSHVLDVGLTGSDWPGPKTQPVAWRLRVLSPEGSELAQAQSYLWSLPDTSRTSSK